MNLQQYLDRLLWSQSELARRTELSLPVIRRAVSGGTITRASALKIVDTIKTELGLERMNASDITGLKVESVTVKKRDTRKKTRKEQ